eukprot:TRINITY_DN22374_c0_g1_i1.p1 TRINITY_DN22374_c0_g1~~TRINITY_DN22374_c0_g1_i1.p1  ORF type:complete len:147 (+),score=46.98 TRINITY_DN22374_c0_g1_i1:3-443(+)
MIGKRWTDFVAEESQTQCFLAISPIVDFQNTLKPEKDEKEHIGQTVGLHLFLVGKEQQKVEVITRHQIYYDTKGEPFWGVLVISDILGIKHVKQEKVYDLDETQRVSEHDTVQAMQLLGSEDDMQGWLEEGDNLGFAELAKFFFGD